MKNDSIRQKMEMRIILRGKLERKFTIMIIMKHMRVLRMKKDIPLNSNLDAFQWFGYSDYISLGSFSLMELLDSKKRIPEPQH